MTDPVFTKGQVITPAYTDGYSITMGKEYQVLEYEFPYGTSYVWPAYVHFLDDHSRECIAHARRFKEVTHD